MTGPRKRTEAQNGVLQRIRNAMLEERQARALAEEEARELIAKRIHDARQKTNSLLYAGYFQAHITKAALTSEGLGTTNRQAADDRIREYMQVANVSTADTIVEQAEVEVPETGIKVDVRDESVAVIFDNYDHPDLGEGLTGEVRFTPMGSPIGTAVENEALAEAYANPFFANYLLDIDIVKEAFA